MTDFLLIPGPMVGAETLAPTAEALRLRGHGAQVPDVLGQSGRLPAWSDWPNLVAALVEGDGPFVLVAHSAASTVAAALTRHGNVAGLVIVDGFIPPARGSAPPSDGALLELIRTLPSVDGVLPPWNEWWKTESNRETVGLTALDARPDLLEQVVAGLPRMTVSWFDDIIELPAWREKPAAFVRTSAYYDFSARAAEGLGWRVERLIGTHLHPLLAPDETADAIIRVSSDM